MASEKPVIVIGGGLAGMSAALRLHEAGRRVLLLERRALLGGRAGSFRAPALGGALVDNSPHVLLGCCTSLLDFYARMGASDYVRFQDRLLFADVSGKRAVMGAAPLPSPLHLLPSLLGFSILSVRQRFEVAGAMLRLAAIAPAERRQFAGQTFASLLSEWGQSRGSVERFWDVICVSALNEPCEQAAAHFGLQVFQEAFFGSRGAYRLAIAEVPLSRLYERAPFEVKLGKAAEAIEFAGERAVAVWAAGERLECGGVVLAVHPAGVESLLPRAVMDTAAELRGISRLAFAPIIGVHLLYDRPVLGSPHLAMVGTRLQWLFADAGNPCLLHGVVSAPGELVERRQEELASLFDGEMRLVCGAAAGARLEASLVVKERHATFRPVPGVEELRPVQTTGVAGLYLAGDYTQTGWPSTMEGAVRSGELAAAAVLRQ